MRNGAIVVRIAAPPVDNAANDTLIAFLAERLGIPKRAVRVVAGGTSRLKRVALDGVTDAEVQRLLLR
jgi:uncharacterized protein